MIRASKVRCVAEYAPLDLLCQRALERKTQQETKSVGIYIIRAGAKGPIKIGYTRDRSPERRLSQIRTSSFMEIRLLAFFEGSVEDEAKLHRKFGTHRLRGEWFEPANDLLKFLKSLPEYSEAPRRHPGRYGLWRHLTEDQIETARAIWHSSLYKTDVAAAEAAGITHATLRLKFGPSGRTRQKISSDDARNMADARHKERLAARMAPEEAIKFWRASRYKRYQDALKKMPGWTKQSAYDELGPRNTGTGRPRKS